MPFSTEFQLHCGSQCTYPCFPGILLTRGKAQISAWLIDYIVFKACFQQYFSYIDAASAPIHAFLEFC